MHSQTQPIQSLKCETLTISDLDFHYFLIQIFVKENQDTISLDVLGFKSGIVKALEAFHGNFGAGMHIDILKYKEHDAQAVLRVPSSLYKMFWQAVILYPLEISGKQAKFVILRNSASLFGISCSTNLDLIDQNDSVWIWAGTTTKIISDGKNSVLPASAEFTCLTVAHNNPNTKSALASTILTETLEQNEKEIAARLSTLIKKPVFFSTDTTVLKYKKRSTLHKNIGFENSTFLVEKCIKNELLSISNTKLGN
ncbi:hypothetical protein BB559_002679 [Furculomyces boomerangus]|uniref:Ribonucleases P/MRP subunit Pop8-like domain-containing protein n=1 Tax=Furculomyces boomerangus TaxID=61424 RepID=A0A2T9YTC7_9FUNG|nr:hypothetical protein BB559_002679 [Furculomyces boomerangus]